MTAYMMRISDLRSDVCSSDLPRLQLAETARNRPGVGDAADRRQLDPLDPFLAGLRRVAVLVENLAVDLVGHRRLEDRGVEREGAAQRVPLDPRLDRLCLLRVHAGIAGVA